MSVRIYDPFNPPDPTLIDPERVCFVKLIGSGTDRHPLLVAVDATGNRIVSGNILSIDEEGLQLMPGINSSLPLPFDSLHKLRLRGLAGRTPAPRASTRRRTRD